MGDPTHLLRIHFNSHEPFHPVLLAGRFGASLVCVSHKHSATYVLSLSGSQFPPMNISMATGAESDQILFCIVSEKTA